eukprot:m.26221 g.26221  ORF g.26221 m.26221 type:complete len:62 (-) comp13285_c0_seq4:70-255(-)
MSMCNCVARTERGLRHVPEREIRSTKNACDNYARGQVTATPACKIAHCVRKGVSTCVWHRC